MVLMIKVTMFKILWNFSFKICLKILQILWMFINSKKCYSFNKFIYFEKKSS